MDDKQRRIRELELELELRKRKNARISPTSVLPDAQSAGGTIVLQNHPKTPSTIPQSIGRQFAIQGSGLAAGALGGPVDIAMLPARGLGVLVAGGGKIAEVLGAGPTATKVKESGLRVLTAPSEVERAQRFINRTTGAPSNLGAGEKSLQTGSQFVGQLASGGALKSGLQKLGAAAMTQLPRVGQALQGAANSRVARFVAPTRPADYATAYGAGVGSEYTQQYAGDNPLLKTGAALVGGLAGGMGAGALARGGGALLQGAASKVAPKTGVGTSLVGQVGKAEVNPEQRFASLAGTIRSAAVNAENSVNSKYKAARELSAGSAISPKGVQDIRGKIAALAIGTADPDHKKLHENVLLNLDELIRQRGGVLRVDDVAETVRKQYSNAGPKMKFAKGEGVRAVDQFLSSALDNPSIVNNLGKKASKAWKDAISSANEKYTKYDDPADIAAIIQEERATQLPLTPAQVGEMFVPSAKGSNLTNKWDAVMTAIPTGEKKYINQTIKSGILHNILKHSSDPTPYGFQINEGNLANNLRQLIGDPAFAKKFTSAEQASIRKLQASLTGARMTAKKLPQLLGATVYALTGQGYGATRLGGEAVVGPATANLDDIIKMLEKPVPIRNPEANFAGAVGVPTVTNQLLPQQTQDNMR